MFSFNLLAAHEGGAVPHFTESCRWSGTEPEHGVLVGQQGLGPPLPGVGRRGMVRKAHGLWAQRCFSIVPAAEELRAAGTTLSFPKCRFCI